VTVLILGGTSEARQLAKELTASGVQVISSLAGRVANPKLPVGEVRVGGFGGPDGLSTWLRDTDISAVVDATHPFAERIGTNAALAAQRTKIPLLRLARPGWEEAPGDVWHWTDDLAEAAATLPELGQRVFLTSGRQGLAAFAGLDDVWFLIRCVDPPDPPLPEHHEVLLARGPYKVDEEHALMVRHRIDVLVTKDSGGTLTSAKLAAARQRGIPVVMIRRPPRPDIEAATTVGEAVTWVLNSSTKSSTVAGT